MADAGTGEDQQAQPPRAGGLGGASAMRNRRGGGDVSRRRRAALLRHVASIGMLLALACALMLPRLDRGWLPHDDGALAHSADRVLHGELPHRDFAEVYTGGLSFINAAAFQLLGRNLLSLRIVLFGVVLLSVPAVYYLATLMLPWHTAIAASALALVWGSPVYPAAMPSWYNLYLGLIASAALVRFALTSSRRWLYFAGVLTGLSCTIKVTGAYFYCSALLFLVFQAQSRAGEQPCSRWWAAAKATSLIGFITAIVVLIRHDLGPSQLLLFIAPPFVVTLLLLGRESRPGTRAPPRLASHVAHYTAGVCLPLVLFLVPYVLTGGIASVITGIVSAPAARFTSAASPPPPPSTLWAVVPLIAIVLAGKQPIPRRSMVFGILLAVFACLPMAGWETATYGMLINIVLWSPLTLLPVAAWLLWRTGDESKPGDYAVFMVASASAVMGLIAYPYWNFVYLSYVAPMLALLMAAVLSRTERRPSVIAPLVLCAFAAFALLRIYPSHFGAPYTARLSIPGAHLRVSADQKTEYERVVRLVEGHAPGRYLYAGPDAPELYYLTRKLNPTPFVFEFLSGNPDSAILRGLDATRADAVIINRAPEFSAPLSGYADRELRSRFPEHEVIGRFEVRWRE